MFKVGLDLPAEVVKETPKPQKKKRKEKVPEKLSGNDLQKMMDELKQGSHGSQGGAAQNQNKKANSNTTESPSKRETSAPSVEKKSGHTSKSDKRKVDKAPKKLHEGEAKAQAAEKPEAAGTKRKADETPRLSSKKLTPMQLKMQQKLSGARFRWINEQLYTTDSAQAFDIFQKQPEVFKEYHDGFRHQVEQWPENPVISFVQQFKDRLVKPLNAPGGLPGDKAGNKVVVADMGCGEAELALKLTQDNKISRRHTRFEVHSFDMAAPNDRITVADIAHVPLPDESCHVVVFCLALMGTNLADFINEGIRILKPNGLVWIAEIKSRFESNDYTEFVDTLKNMGLYHRTTDDSNKMFVKFEFVKLPHKLAKAKETHPEISLKPCIYKRR